MQRISKLQLVKLLVSWGIVSVLAVLILETFFLFVCKARFEWWNVVAGLFWSSAVVLSVAFLRKTLNAKYLFLAFWYGLIFGLGSTLIVGTITVFNVDYDFARRDLFMLVVAGIILIGFSVKWILAMTFELECEEKEEVLLLILYFLGWWFLIAELSDFLLSAAILVMGCILFAVFIGIVITLSRIPYISYIFLPFILPFKGVYLVLRWVTREVLRVWPSIRPLFVQ